MNDSNNHTNDGVAVLAALGIIVTAWIGVSSILDDSQSKDAAIADLKQQLNDARKDTILCEGKFQGYLQGRR
ncbi:MAG TPA: hypothetical protein V6D12_01815 [Candidatus Obscuribacterales bacterium]